MVTNNRNETDHTFCICAYKESPYLEECVKSLIGQNRKSHIIMVTSTPNQYIQSIADKYQVPLIINDGEGGITQDWNFGLKQVKTRYATIAHQDDVYLKDYADNICNMMYREKMPLIAFSDYYEIRNGECVHDTKMLKIKRIMLYPLRFKLFWKSKFVRRRILSIGDPICCPAVTFCLDYIPQPIFRHGFRSCEDWEAWEMISKKKGSFLYTSEPLMCHRIHEESATTAIIQDQARAEENFIMYCKFWPKGIARFINHFYNKSEKSNDLSS